MRLTYESWEKLARMSRDEIRDLQNRKLASFVQHQLPYSPYYRELFKREGLSFTDIQNVGDLV